MLEARSLLLSALKPSRDNSHSSFLGKLPRGGDLMHDKRFIYCIFKGIYYWGCHLTALYQTLLDLFAFFF